ncbi:MAG: hypothetical protein U0359_33220 [Byssovorax sp.]
MLRVGDAGANGWVAADGALHVLVNGRPIHRITDAHSACEASDGSCDVLADVFETLKVGTPEAEAPALNIDIKCEHSRTAVPPFEILEVVSEKKRRDPAHEEPIDEVTISIRSKGDPLPTKVTIRRDGDLIEEVKLEGGVARFKASCLPEYAGFWSKKFWGEGTEYVIGGTGVSIQVWAHPSHKWAAALESPSIWKRSRGTEATQEATAALKESMPAMFKKKVEIKAQVVSRWKPWSGLSISTTNEGTIQRVRAHPNVHSFDLPTEPEPGDIGHEFFKVYLDDEEFASCASRLPERVQHVFSGVRKIGQWVRTFVEVIEKVENWATLVKDCLKTVALGFYQDWEVEALQGKLEFYAEWKEGLDYRCFLAMGIKAELTIFKIRYEAHWGAKWAHFEGSIFIGGEGTLGASFSGERQSPEESSHLLVQSTAVLEVMVGAQLQAGEYAQLEAKAKTGFKLEVKFIFGASASGHEWSGVFSWTGVKVQAKVSTWLGFTKTFAADLAEYVPALGEHVIHKWGTATP